MANTSGFDSSRNSVFRRRTAQGTVGVVTRHIRSHRKCNFRVHDSTSPSLWASCPTPLEAAPSSSLPLVSPWGLYGRLRYCMSRRSWPCRGSLGCHAVAVLQTAAFRARAMPVGLLHAPVRPPLCQKRKRDIAGNIK